MAIHCYKYCLFSIMNEVVTIFSGLIMNKYVLVNRMKVKISQIALYKWMGKSRFVFKLTQLEVLLTPLVIKSLGRFVTERTLHSEDSLSKYENYSVILYIF